MLLYRSDLPFFFESVMEEAGSGAVLAFFFLEDVLFHFFHDSLGSP